MSYNISQFTVIGLHGEMTVSIPIVDNKLVIVGLNGLGKSTLLSIFYLFVSRQWLKLVEMPFSVLIVTVNGRDIEISKEELTSYSVTRRDIARHMPRYRSMGDRRIWDAAEIIDILDRPEIDQQKYFRALGLSPADTEYFRYALNQDKTGKKRLRRFTDNNEYLAKVFTHQVVYLPTYRRIEKELSIVFPGLEEELKRLHEHRKRVRQRVGGQYVELVEFGMDDVDETLKRTLARIKDTARAELNSLAGSYLRDVIRGEGRSYDSSFVSNLTDDELDDVLNRVEENTLLDNDKQLLRGVIQRIRDGFGTSSEDEYVAHFLTKLLNVGATIKANENPVNNFIDVCNEYLDGKSLIYDESKYDLTIRRDDGSPIELKMLSSGEKQIVSLFSHIYLGDSGPYVVIIDEPELSLSVNWQKRLLPDIENSGRCTFIAAVTHSPFIFDNSFDPHTIDLAKFIGTH